MDVPANLAALGVTLNVYNSLTFFNSSTVLTTVTVGAYLRYNLSSALNNSSTASLTLVYTLNSCNGFLPGNYPCFTKDVPIYYA
jgi:hypothetical protein